MRGVNVKEWIQKDMKRGESRSDYKRDAEGKIAFIDSHHSPKNGDLMT